MPFRAVSLSTVLLMGSALAQVRPSPISDREIFLVEDPQSRRWCGYSSKSASKSEAERLNAMVVVGVENTNGLISTVHVTEWDESGDWSVDDTYSLDKKQKLQTLLRVTDNFSLGITQERQYRIENGEAVMKSSRSRAGRTGTPIADLSSDDLPDVPITSDLRSFPFWPLIRDRRHEVLSKGVACEAVKSR